MTATETTEIGWTDARVTRLRSLWKEGNSASHIANELGGVTRNAVIGKIHRLNLPKRTNAKSPQIIAAQRRGKRQIRRNEARVVLLTTVALPRPALDIDIKHLLPGQCKWPTSPGRPHLFCGHPWHGEHGPYCEAHSRVAYRREYPRERHDLTIAATIVQSEQRMAA